MFAQNLYKYIKAPQFAVQSLYDTWAIPHILGITCIKEASLENCDASDRKVI